MLLLIPVSTDAPVYHFPAATIGLIVVNTLLFVFTGFGNPEVLDPFILWFGAFHPSQWLTAFFLHASLSHLLGNMVFLWIFGLVVEGKLGWKKFLPLYLVIGICQCSVEQIIMLGADREAVWEQQWELRQQQAEEELIDGDDGDGPNDVEGAVVPGFQEWDDDITPEERQAVMDALQQEQARAEAADRDDKHEGADDAVVKEPLMYGALGASGVIFSLMAMSLIWAPKNDITVFFWFLTRVFWFPLTIFWFALLFIGFDILNLLAGQFRMSTAFLHVMGAITGAAFGVVLFKTGSVDCEDWDLFSVLSGNYGPYVRDLYGFRTPGKTNKYSKKGGAKDPRKRSRIQKIGDLIENEEFLTAAEELFNLRVSQPRSKLSEQHLRELGTGLVSARFLEEAEVVLEEYIEKYPGTSNWACMRLAAIQLQENGQPNAAYETLKGIAKEGLTDAELKTARRIAAAARQQIDAGVEDRAPDW